MILPSYLLLLVSGFIVVACATAVACIQTVAGILAIAGVPSVVRVSAVPFEHAVAGGAVVDGVLAVASGSGFTYWHWPVQMRHIRQCCGSGSESGSTASTCFWASRIRIH
jgi:hypothetical protein